MKKAIINWWEFKYSENGEIKKERFGTETEMNKFIKSIIKNPNVKYIGKSRDVDYPIGFDCYNEAELEKMQYVERAAI
jgi:hypothetical protein